MDESEKFSIRIQCDHSGEMIDHEITVEDIFLHSCQEDDIPMMEQPILEV
jgi:hypothetical protein